MYPRALVQRESVPVDRREDRKRVVGTDDTCLLCINQTQRNTCCARVSLLPSRRAEKDQIRGRKGLVWTGRAGRMCNFQRPIE